MSPARQIANKCIDLARKIALEKVFVDAAGEIEEMVSIELDARSVELRQLKARVGFLFDAIAHGDEQHRAWLKEAIERHFQGLPVPPPTPKAKPGRSHAEAMRMILAAAGMTTLSYEEAVAVYLRARGILRDGEEILGAPIPDDWTPPT